MKKNWWKILAVVFVAYAIIAGLLMDVPALPILHESIRNLYFHVTMWFGMIILLTVSVIYSIKFLSKANPNDDIVATESANISILLGSLGCMTGSIWAKFTWSQSDLFSIQGWWVDDVKLNGAAITMLIYFAYLILRGSIDDEQKRGRIAAVYNIFAYVMMLVFIGIYPRMHNSLHPGNGGNPGFGVYDVDKKMLLVFYPAIIGWTLLGVWMMSLRIRIGKLKMSELYNTSKIPGLHFE